MNIIVTGASGGIGRAICALLEKEHNVLKFDLIGHGKNFYKVDLTNLHEVKNTLTRIPQKNKIDVLINCVGYYGIKKFSSFSYDDFYKSLRVNLLGPLNICVEVGKIMEKHGKGKIVNISSAAAFSGSHDLGYSSSKAALIGLTKSLAKNLSPGGITVISVAPGIVDTKMSRKMSNLRKRETISRTFEKRMTKPKEVAEVVNFIVTANTNYLSGSTIHVNGGLLLN